MGKPKAKESNLQTVLGLAIGSNFVGWGLLEFDRKGPTRIIDGGVRAFDAGVVGSLKQGREKSRQTQRREARHRRRRAGRQVTRMTNVARTLQGAGMLPEGDLSHGSARNDYFATLDRAIYDAHDTGDHADELLNHLPYFLRARALDLPLTLHELGRAYYHLAQRRGFLSNRKRGDDEEETGTVKPAIKELIGEMEKIGARTLGEYLAKSDPVNERRIRDRWTGRKMYEHEFEQIWAAQQTHHPGILMDELRGKLHFAIFFQRPLKSQKGLVGKCDLEPQHRRMALALLPAQRFRLLQRVNDLKICFEDGSEPGCLTSEQRSALLDALDTEGELTFGKARTAIGLKRTGTKFNLEEGGEKSLIGNRTGAKLRGVFGERWDRFTDQHRSQILSEVLGVHKEETMARRGREVWELDAEDAEELASVRLEEGYCAHSKEALKKILPLMEQGLQYATAKKEAYGDDEESRTKIACDLLPPVNESGIELGNPALQRALTELRKVVNHIIKRHGKPDRIRVELARDLKRAKKKRENIWKRSRSREKERDAARKFLEECGDPQPSRADVDKYLLWVECNKECPYTGESITQAALFGMESEFDIEHIWPFSRTLEDGFHNKTLCYHEESRATKGNKTPFEAYAERDEWDAIVQRIEKFRGDAAAEKLRRFKAETLPDLGHFLNRQLNDTHYASKLAARYLGLLYGDKALRKIEVSTGQITVHLCNAWNLKGILSDGPRKSRDDHRHRIVEAIVIALVDCGMVKKVSKAAQQQFKEKGRERGWWKRLEEPWDGFLSDVEEAIAGVITSHRVNRRVRGQLHEDTNYTAPRVDEDGSEYVAVRKPLGPGFSQKDVSNILDPTLRAVVQKHLDELGGDPKKAFSDTANHPRLTNGLPVHRARIKRRKPVFRVGEGAATRFVTTATNHHMAIYSTTDSRGNVKWTYVMVSRLEANQRAKRGVPAIDREQRDDWHFVFSLTSGEMIEFKLEEGNLEIFVVRTISQGNVEMCRVNDARDKKTIRKTGDWIKKSVNVLCQMNARKVIISPLGEVLPAND